MARPSLRRLTPRFDLICVSLFEGTATAFVSVENSFHQPVNPFCGLSRRIDSTTGRKDVHAGGHAVIDTEVEWARPWRLSAPRSLPARFAAVS
jgi:hypothetical protein